MSDRELLRECFARFEELSRELPNSSMWWTAGDRRFQKTMNKVKDALVEAALKPAPREANYEPPTGWELRCEKCGRQQGMACGWPSNCPTGQGSREYVPQA